MESRQCIADFFLQSTLGLQGVAFGITVPGLLELPDGRLQLDECGE
jgi:hypothetical protein